MVDIYVNDNGTVSKVKTLHVNDGGVVKAVKEGYVNDNGTVKQFYASAGPPSAPGNFRSTAVTSTTVTLAWDASVVNGFPVTFYVLERSTDGVNWDTPISVASGTLTYQYTGLASTTTYQFRIKAQSAAGDSGFSQTSAQTVAGPPLTPTASIRTTSTTSSSVTVRVTPNASGPTQTHFDVDVYSWATGQPVFAKTQSFANTTTPGFSDLIVTGLTSNYSYYFVVAARNAAGSSPVAEAGWMVTSRSGTSSASNVFTEVDPCDTGTFKDIGYGTNLASEGGCGVVFGTGPAVIAGKTVHLIARPGAQKFTLQLLGNNTNQFFIRKISVYSNTSSDDARTFEPGDAVFTSGAGTTGQICRWEWTLPGDMPWLASRNYQFAVET